jgi:hypothetical protein
MGNRRAAVAPDDRMQRFEQELEELANHLKVLPYVDHTQSELASDLKKVRHAAAGTLDVLRQLQIADSSEAPNFPLFHALLFGLNRRREKKGLPPLNGSDFPALAVSALIELQEAAETALITDGPRRGNAARRTKNQAHKERAAMAFVLRYHAIFGDWPPKSNEGPCVDAMRRFLARIGFNEAVDAAGVLTRAIKEEEKAERERKAFGDAQP